MKRRYAIFAVVFAVSILMGIQAVEVAEANPVPWPYKPNQERPILAIETPQTIQTTNITLMSTLA